MACELHRAVPCPALPSPCSFFFFFNLQAFSQSVFFFLSLLKVREQNLKKNPQIIFHLLERQRKIRGASPICWFTSQMLIPAGLGPDPAGRPPELSLDFPTWVARVKAVTPSPTACQEGVRVLKLEPPPRDSNPGPARWDVGLPSAICTFLPRTAPRTARALCI